MRILDRARFVLVFTLLGAYLASCGSISDKNPTPTLVTTRTERALFPAFFLLQEGDGPGTITLDRSQLPISIGLTSTSASASILLYEYQGNLVPRVKQQLASGEDEFVHVSQVGPEQIKVQVDLNNPWTATASNLESGNFLEIPGTISGLGSHIVFFSQGQPRYVRVEADPGVGAFFTLRAIRSVVGSPDIIAASLSQISDTFPLAPEYEGLLIETEGSWRLHVVDRADLLD